MMSLATDNSFGEYVILAFDENFDAVRSEKRPANSDHCSFTAPPPVTIIRAPAEDAPLAAPPARRRGSGHSKQSRITSFWMTDSSPCFAIPSLLTTAFLVSSAVSTLPTGARRSLRLPTRIRNRKISGGRVDEGGRIAEDASKKLNINN